MTILEKALSAWRNNSKNIKQYEIRDSIFRWVYWNIIDLFSK
jgi:hypothetical protein